MRAVALLLALLAASAAAYGKEAACVWEFREPFPALALTEYIGCFTDKFAAVERDLVASVYLEDKMTPDLCEEKCGKQGSKYFGLQYGGECWCGNSYGRHGQLDDTECNSKCKGDPTALCGGELKNSVYKITREFPKVETASSNRPLLALVMIVKDEAHTLPNTLLSLKPYIDTYFILDTGSTDGTPEAIRKTLGDGGEIHHEPFINYGASRNRVLEIAQKAKNPPIFALMLSADETVYNGAALRKFCEEHRNSDGPMHEAYPIQMDVGWRFDSLRLSRVDKGWRYVGRVHEYLASPDRKYRPTMRVPDVYIKFRVTDHERRSKREYKILEILQQELKDEPWNTRASFYIARTWNVIGNHSEALKQFRHRVSMGGWQEEVYESLYAIGWQLKALKAPWHEVQQAFLDAHEHSPGRGEPLYAIASHWFQEKKYGLAYLFAHRCSQLPYPVRAVLWVQADVYKWQCHAIVGKTGLHVNEPQTGLISLLKAMKHQPNDKAMRGELEKYRKKLGTEAVDEAMAEVDAAASSDGGTTKKLPSAKRQQQKATEQQQQQQEEASAPSTPFKSLRPGRARPQPRPAGAAAAAVALTEDGKAARGDGGEPTSSSSSSGTGNSWTMFLVVLFLAVVFAIVALALRSGGGVGGRGSGKGGAAGVFSALGAGADKIV